MLEVMLCISRIWHLLRTNSVYAQFVGYNLTVSRHFIRSVLLYHEIFRTKFLLLYSNVLLFKAIKAKAERNFGTGALFPF